MKKYEIFLFDADGTLFDYDLAEENALKIMFEYCKFNYSQSIREKYREINLKMWDRYEKDEISKEELQIQRFEEFFKEIDVFYDCRDFNEKYLKELGKGNFLINGAFEICKSIIDKNKKIYIVTNGILATQKSRIEHSIVKDFISDFFVSEIIGSQKPEKAYFDYVFAHIENVSKDLILIIGDNLKADILGGINAGIDNCWFNNNSKINNTDIKPTYEINDLYELNKFI